MSNIYILHGQMHLTILQEMNITQITILQQIKSLVLQLLSNKSHQAKFKRVRKYGRP